MWQTNLLAFVCVLVTVLAVMQTTEVCSYSDTRGLDLSRTCLFEGQIFIKVVAFFAGVAGLVVCRAVASKVQVWRKFTLSFFSFFSVGILSVVRKSFFGLFFIGIPLKTRAKAQIGQSRPFWLSHEAGYKSKGSQGIVLFLLLPGLAVLAKTVSYKPRTATILEARPPPSSWEQTNTTTTTNLAKVS